MSNHPNRGTGSPCRNPRAAEIIAAREASGLSQEQAAALGCWGVRTWQQWEAGDRTMHPAFWRYFNIVRPKKKGSR